MDEYLKNIPSYLSSTFELLDDVPEPSLSSLDESVISNQDISPPVREDSYSDGEVVHSIMTSTPQRRNDQRRSVSLMDVSKIDAFSSRPLGNMLASWETIGSQSSVGKSRDSGYIHSGSLLSVNSGKLSEIKGGSDQVHTIIEECTRLKRELEYSEVLINTLQESNNDLRMKCAAAHNRISEMRLKSTNHCDCRSQQYSKSAPKNSVLADSIFLSSSSDSSSSDESSRSSSPETVAHSHYSFQHSGTNLLKSISKVDNFLKVEEESCSDNSIDNSGQILPKISQSISSDTCKDVDWKIDDVLKETNHSLINYDQELSKSSETIKNNRNSQIYKNKNTSTEDMFRKFEDSKINENVSRSNQEEHLEKECREILPSKTEILSEISRPFNIEDTGEEKSPSSAESNFNLKIKQSRSADNMFNDINGEEETSSDDKSVFVANEMNGKIWVGSFKVWGDSSIRVATKSPVIAQTPPAVKNQSITPCYEDLNVNQIVVNSKDHINLNFRVPNSSELRLTATPSIRCVRPASAYCSFPSSPEILRSHQVSLSNNSHNKQENRTTQRPLSQGKVIPSYKDSVNISVSSRYDRLQFQISQNCNHSTSIKPKTYQTDSKKEKSSNAVIHNNKIESNLVDSNASSPNTSSCRDNLSNLGVSVSKSSSKILCSDSVLDKWKTFKSKFEKLSLGSLISSDSQDKSNVSKVSNSSSNTSKQNSPIVKESNFHFDTSDKESVLSNSSSHLCSLEGQDGILCNSSQSQSMQDCLEKANEYAKELSRGLARLPSRLDYIQSIGKP